MGVSAGGAKGRSCFIGNLLIFFRAVELSENVVM